MDSFTLSGAKEGKKGTNIFAGGEGEGEGALTDDCLAVGLDHGPADDGAAHDEELPEEPSGLRNHPSAAERISHADAVRD